ncbi:MAG: 23S rRNA (adenine(2503)-C(2))-methyltransferase RlmN [Ruminococcus sp.]|nr:23S rRNA (adenine(2503)-C(2))-methyltransferase RlmN [Ruminococcus sp.]
MLTDIKSMNLAEISAYLTDNGFEKFRAKQVLSWIKQDAATFDEMTNLPAKLRDFLKQNAYLAKAEIVRVQRSKIDATEKFLFELFDGEFVEGVLMRYHHGLSVCISTQVGCKMGCTFCATGKSGFSRSLTASEMIAQIRSAELHAGERISNVVLMGMGEPFDNYENVIRFLRLVSSEDSLHIGMRHITISTCGIVPRMRDFADLELQCGLSVSLHAPDNEARSRTMPINRRYPISQVIAACQYYIKKTNRRITFEYALISGENDSDDHARRLAALLTGMLCHVNLIPVNNVTGAGYQKSTLKRQNAFVNILSAAGINATVRRTLGSDIDASCGQLKRNFMKGDV